MTEPDPDPVGRLQLLASAIAGRRMEVSSAEPGMETWTDGATVFTDGSALARDQVRAVVVQASLVAAGSFAPDVLGRLARRPAQLRRYLTIEGHRALASQDALLPSSVGLLIDRAVATMSDGPATSATIAAGAGDLPDPPGAFGAIVPKQIRPGPVIAVQAEAIEHAPRRAREQVLRELDDGEELDRDSASVDFSPVGGGGAIGRLLQKLLGSSRTSGGGEPGAELQTHTTARATRRPGAVTSSGRVAQLDGVGLVGPRGAKYPEWNVYSRRYRPDWCTVTETKPESVGTDRLVDRESTALRRPLARLGVDLERRHRQLQGDDLDIDAVVESRADIVAGSTPSEAVYIESLRSRRDLSVLILLDVSGSSGDPSPAGATVHEHQRAAAIALTAALHGLGDRVALYGFRSQGRGAVQILPLKRFADGYDAAVERRIGGVVPGAYTRIGAAVRHGGSVIETDGGTARRLLVVLSDGFAYDHGYEGDYGEADARRALAEARRAGTACLCLSIGAGTDTDALRRVFGTAAHARMPDVASLAPVVGSLFRSALRLAAQQRRTAQRTERTRERLRIEGNSA